MLAARCALATTAILLCSCGEPLVSGATLDMPIFSIHGNIEPAPTEPQLRVGILWVDPTQEPGAKNSVSGSELVDDQIDADGHYTLDFYAPPPDDAVHWLKSGDDAEAVVAFAWGEIVLYEDRDGDGTFVVGPVSEGSEMQSADLYRGMPASKIVLHVTKPLPVEQNIIPELAAAITSPGYELGFVNCSVNPPRVGRTDLDEASLQLIEPSRAFPDLRTCLQSHPAPPVTEQTD